MGINGKQYKYRRGRLSKLIVVVYATTKACYNVEYQYFALFLIDYSCIFMLHSVLYTRILYNSFLYPLPTSSHTPINIMLEH